MTDWQPPQAPGGEPPPPAAPGPENLVPTVQSPAPVMPAPAGGQFVHGITRPCPACQHDSGPGYACQWCQQVLALPAGYKLTGIGKRFGAFCLDGVLVIVTLLVGYYIWSLIIWGRGQTPAKQILKMRIVDAQTGSNISWGKMAARELPFKILINLAASFVIFPIFWLLWDKSRQQLYDKMAGTIVVEDPQNLLDPRNREQGPGQALGGDGGGSNFDPPAPPPDFMNAG